MSEFEPPRRTNMTELSSFKSFARLDLGPSKPAAAKKSSHLVKFAEEDAFDEADEEEGEQSEAVYEKTDQPRSQSGTVIIVVGCTLLLGLLGFAWSFHSFLVNELGQSRRR